MKFCAGRGAAPLLRTASSIAAGVPVAMLTGLGYYLKISLWWTVLPLLLWAVAIGWYVPRFCATIQGAFCRGNVRIVYGLLLRREAFVPLSSLRTFELWAPPLHRLFRCRTVVLRFAGGATVLPLLSCEAAERLTVMLEKNEE